VYSCTDVGVLCAGAGAGVCVCACVYVCDQEFYRCTGVDVYNQDFYRCAGVGVYVIRVLQVYRCRCV
jgi:hypothetical protein